MLILAGVI